MVLGLATCVRAAPGHARYGKNRPIHPGSWHPTEKTGQIGRHDRRQADADECQEMGAFNMTLPTLPLASP